MGGAGNGTFVNKLDYITQPQRALGSRRSLVALYGKLVILIIHVFHYLYQCQYCIMHHCINVSYFITYDDDDNGNVRKKLIVRLNIKYNNNVSSPHSLHYRTEHHVLRQSICWYLQSGVKTM